MADLPRTHPDLIALATRFRITREALDECLRIRQQGATAMGTTISEATSDLLDSLRGGPIGRILVVRGYLADAEGTAFDAGLAVNRVPPGPVTVLQSRDAEPSAPRAAGRKFGKYTLIRELGRGGMGVVYQARHEALESDFAVKVLLAGDDASADAVKRFKREAQVSAKLRHPGIVAVHDIGVEEGKTYFAMEFVEGIPLDRILADPVAAGLAPAKGPQGSAPGLPPRVAVRMTQEIAEAIQAAHEAGVIHRDLKPSNVIRDRRDRLKVMDFGLARMVDSGEAKGTRTGTLMGTPAYMSPEQAEGRVREVDERSDVYQLGAILYELLTGRAPYSGTTQMEMVLNVMHTDPVAPRRVNPAIDRDAETVCLKAMAREKTRRYASARALAEDCARLLAGEAIQARPEAWWETGARWAKRRKVIATAAAAVLLAAGVALAMGWRAWSAVQEQERERIGRAQAEAEKRQLVEKVLADLRKEAELYLDAVLKLRRAGLPAAQSAEYADRLAAAVADAVRCEPARPEPHYHLGRLHRALQRFDTALQAQNDALKKDSTYAPSRYERMVLEALRYGDRIRELRENWAQEEGLRLKESGALRKGGLGGQAARSRPPDADLAARDAEARTLRNALQADLHALDAADLSALPHARVSCAHGLEAAYSEGTPEATERARGLLEDAVREDPQLEEAFEGLAWIALSAGDAPGAIATYTRALESDRGYVPHWIARARSHYQIGFAAWNRGEDPGAEYQCALADYAKARELDPTSEPAWRRSGGVNLYWGTYLSGHGQDPTARFADAEAECSKAIELAPDRPEPRTVRGLARAAQATHLMTHGGDAAETLRKAESDFGRALELDPHRVEALRGRGMVRHNLGFLQRAQRDEPSGPFAQADADYDRALELDPTAPEAWMQRGNLRLARGHARADRGEDPGELFAQAVDDLSKALQLAPQSAAIWEDRGQARMIWATARAQRGEESAPWNDAADADFAKAVELAPGSFDGWKRWGDLAMNRGILAAARRVDPSPFYRTARERYGKALEIDPTSALVWRTLAGVGANAAYYGSSVGQDPSVPFAEADAAYAKALELAPASRATWIARADLLVNVGTLRIGTGADPTESYATALACLDRSLDLRPGDPVALAKRGGLRAKWGIHLAKQGEDPSSLLTEGLKDLDQALLATPMNAEAVWFRGEVHLQQDRFAAAVADLEMAMKLAPQLEPHIRGSLACARQLKSSAEDPNKPAWGKTLDLAYSLLNGGEYARAGTTFLDGLEGFEKDLAAAGEEDRKAALADPGIREMRVTAHYNLACIFALRSAGKGSPTAAPRPIAAEKSGNLRDRAFEHLGKSIAAGLQDFVHLRADSDLAPLHADSRWDTLLRAHAAGGK